MAATKAQFEELTGGRIVEGYSLTEAMMACVVNPLNGFNKVGSVGIPLRMSKSQLSMRTRRAIAEKRRERRDYRQGAAVDGRVLQQS